MTWLVPLPVTIPLLGAALTLLMAGRPRAQRTVSLTALTATLFVSGMLLFLTSLTGLVLLVLRHSRVMGVLLIVHLAVVLVLLLTLPYGKFVHGLYRLLALVRYHAE